MCATWTLRRIGYFYRSFCIFRAGTVHFPGPPRISCKSRTPLRALLLNGSLLGIEPINFPSLRSFMNAKDRGYYFVPAHRIVTKKDI